MLGTIKDLNDSNNSKMWIQAPQTKAGKGETGIVKSPCCNKYSNNLKKYTFFS
jgi:hypothetical protein